MTHTDPSGHVSCSGANWDDGPQCAKQDSNGNYLNKEFDTKGNADLQKSIKKRYKWSLGDGFSTQELAKMYQTGMDIERYVDNFSGGNGLAWMNKNMSDIHIAHSSDAPFWLPHGRNTNFPGWATGGTGNTIYLASGFHPADFAHELAEQWDLYSSKWALPSGYVGGVADQLNLVEGGTIWANPFNYRRWRNNYDENFQVVALGNLFHSGAYANTSSEDYFAETFSTMIYPDSQQYSSDMPNSAETYVNLMIMYH